MLPQPRLRSMSSSWELLVDVAAAGLAITGTTRPALDDITAIDQCVSRIERALSTQIAGLLVVVDPARP